MLELKNVSKQYLDGTRKQTIIQNINLEIGKNEFITIRGKSGGGKSTLLNIIGLLSDPTSGNVMYNGQSLDYTKPKEIEKLRREKIGFVFQTPNLISCLTPMDNILLPSFDSDQKRVKEYAQNLLERVDLKDKMYAKTKALSGGEAQRVSIVRALINSPDILLCDEPTGALDVATGDRVMNLLCEIWEERECSMIIVTHDPNIAKLGHRQFVLERGNLIEES